jgi:hypothetical protein
VVGHFEARFHGRHFRAVFRKETGETRCVRRRNTADFPFHFRHVRGGVNPSSRAKERAILRIQPDQFEFLAQARAGNLKDFVEDPVLKKNGLADVDLEISVCLSSGSAADSRAPLKKLHSYARRRDENGGREPARPGADDND